MMIQATDKRPGYTAALRTPYMLFDSTCMELFYVFLGDANITLTIDVLTEDLEVNQHM